MIRLPPKHPRQAAQLGRPLTSLKGVGPGRASVMAGRGLHTILDLLFFLPVRYEDRRRVLTVSETGPERDALVSVRVVSAREHVFPRTGKRVFSAIAEDGTGRMEFLWFHYRPAHLTGLLKRGAHFLAYGRVQVNRGERQMIHPDLTPLKDPDPGEATGYHPVYPSIIRLSGRFILRAVREALKQCGGSSCIPDPVPRAVTQHLGLPPLGDALAGVHFPPPGVPFSDLMEAASPFHRRLVFDRFLGVMMNVLLRRRRRQERNCPVLRLPDDLSGRWPGWFGFAPTGDQLRAVGDILGDMRAGRPMNRLLQGDVGCGKTAVAMAAAWAAASNGMQTALMVPTQVLAHQHLDSFAALPSRMGLNTVILTGALPGHERRRVLEGIETGRFNLVIGTQALIQESVTFHRLGLVIIDEQHRFGVRQRALLDGKGIDSHLLVMTATPIPRTLAMTVYADLAVSTIREHPRGRLPVVTRLAPEEKKREVFEAVMDRLARGQQALVVCPVIETSEEEDLKSAREMHERLKRILPPPYNVGLLHGRMKPDEKEAVLDRFRRKEVHLLVGTTVMEVGLHAPNATVMVVEHPERFGLAQLHQLRGRVGRGSAGGLFFLMISKEVSDRARLRLRFLEESSDGFEIAAKDLETRGQGELAGLRQAGAGELDYRDMIREPELLLEAKRACREILAADPDLSLPQHALLRAMAGVRP